MKCYNQIINNNCNYFYSNENDIEYLNIFSIIIIFFTYCRMISIIFSNS